MAQYGCTKCGSTGSVMEMRRVIVTIGPDKELQCAGIVPVQRCSSAKCNAMSTPSNLEFGAPVNLAPIAPMPEVVEADVDARKQKMKDLLEMKDKIAKLEDELVEPAETDPPDEPESYDAVEEARDSVDEPGR